MRIPKPLSLRPLVGMIEPLIGEATLVTLDFVAEEQKQTNWCWAAVSTSVGLFYGTGNWTQCEVATEQVNSLVDPGENHNCCETPGSDACDQYGYLNPALHHVNAFFKATSGKPPADRIFSRISEMREVVCVRVAWFGGGSHFTTIHGFTDPSSASDIYLTVSDTVQGWGTTTMLYSEFPVQYKSGGTWTDTYWTKNILGPSCEFGSGEKTTVALDNNANCVCLHTCSRQITSQLGRVDFINQTINWGQPVSYGTGESISIDVDDFGRCVAVHVDYGHLYYRVGAINTSSSLIDWGTSLDYGIGDSNEIALTVLGVALSVHVDKERLYYRMGWLNDDRTITWMNQAEYGIGVQNSIALDDQFNCVEVHVGSGPEIGQISYRVGQLNVLNSIVTWGPSIEFDKGSNVNITLDNSQHCRVVLVDGTSGSNKLIYRMGIVDFVNHEIEWGPRTEYDLGDSNSLGLDDTGKSVEVHANSGRLFSKTGR
jgi:hypothetical protein